MRGGGRGAVRVDEVRGRAGARGEKVRRVRYLFDK